VKVAGPTWRELLDLDWEVERLLLDAAEAAQAPLRAAGGHCGTCGSGLYTNGTCPVCDRPPR
jgi:hypothetical protein